MRKNTSSKVLVISALLVLMASSRAFAHRGADSLIIARGYCRDIYKELKNNTGTDTLAVQQLVKNYIFDTRVHFTPEEWKKAYSYIMKDENEHLWCSLKSYILKNSLILEMGE